MPEDLLGWGKIAEALEKGTREVRELAKVYLEPVARAKGQLHADKIKHQCFKNAVKMLQEADHLLRDAGVTKRKLDLKVVIPIIEHSSLVEEEDLTSKRAGLLASAAAGDPVHVSYPKILAELTAAEAKILDLLFQWKEDETRVANWSPQEHTIGKVTREIGLANKEFQIATENLQRHRLGRTDMFWTDFDEQSLSDDRRLLLTPFGSDFVRACRGPHAQSKK